MQPAPVVGGWPLGFLPPNLANMPLNLSHPMTSSKPRVGLGVICRCLSPNGSVECLLLKRGPKFVSPLKWSFPGGRLDEDHESEDDGERSTIRELEKECGGGTPGGLPPLIHIESYKSGRTLYHVFVIDCDAQTTWLNWQPAVTPKHTGEIDQSSGDLVLQGKNYCATNGFCWTDLQSLIEECMVVGNMDQDSVNSSELQHGLVRWVKSNGENILKTLMARSPKLERHRRYPPTGNGSVGQPSKGFVSGGRPRSGSAGSRARKPPQDGHLFPNPIIPGQQVFRPPDHYNNQATPPLMQMGMPPMAGATGSVGHIPGELGGDHTHLYYSPPVGAASTGYMQPESTNHSQQQSPIKIVGTETDKTGYTPFEGGGNTDSTVIDLSSPPNNIQQQQQSSYNAAEMYPHHSPSDYDPSSVYHSPAAALPPSSSQQPMNPQVNVDMNNVIVSPPSHDYPRYNQQTKRNDMCRNYLNGHCLFGEKCWFVHSDQKPHREPLLGPGGILNTAALAVMQQPPGMFPGNLAGMDHQYMSQYVNPKSPMNGGQVNPGGNPPPTAWQLPGVVNRPPPMFPFIPRGFVGPPGVQPQMLLRPMMYQNRFGIPGQMDQLNVPHIPDPVLRFRLLSEGMIKTRDSSSNDNIISDISALCVRADHFFVTFSNCLRDYRVMFGSDRPTDNNQLTSEHVLSNNITCLHHSKVTPTSLVIGTADDGVYMFDTKRSGPSNPLTPIHEPQQPSDAIVTALVHFTTIAAAQVVVVGNSKGDVTWYIAQPPMKTFTVLSHQKAHTPHPVVSVQTMGSCLISAAGNGIVCLWTMKSPEPVLLESFQAHSGSLLNVHVLDTSCFLTVGVNHHLSPEVTSNEKALVPHEATPPDSTIQQPATATSQQQVPTDNNTNNATSSPPVEEDIVSTFKNLSIHPNSSVSQWEYGNPVKNIKTLDNIGSVTCSAFYQHTLLGNRFLALGLMGGAVKICNLPNLTTASEIHFQDIIDQNCSHIALNLSRDKEHTYNFNFKNPFRDLILTSVWSDGRVMVCQVDHRRIT